MGVVIVILNWTFVLMNTAPMISCSQINLVPRVSRLTAPSPKMRDPGDEVAIKSLA